jgi:hypothetical protein
MKSLKPPRAPRADYDSKSNTWRKNRQLGNRDVKWNASSLELLLHLAPTVRAHLVGNSHVSAPTPFGFITSVFIPHMK